MKVRYYSPKVTAELLAKEDILCAPTELNRVGTPNYDPNIKRDNANQSFATLTDFSRFL